MPGKFLKKWWKQAKLLKESLRKKILMQVTDKSEIETLTESVISENKKEADQHFTSEVMKNQIAKQILNC